MQGGTKDTERAIMDKTDQVGNNCLTYKETVQGVTTRCKIYNKMVQMLESKSVRETVGQHWVCQKNTRLAKARDLAKDLGLDSGRGDVLLRKQCSLRQCYGGHSQAHNTIRIAFFGLLHPVFRYLESLL